MKKATVVPIDTNAAREPVSYYTHENLRAQMVDANTKWFILVLVLVVLFVGSNAFWIIRETQFATETTEIEVKTEDGGNANYIGNDGDIYNGEHQSKEDPSRP